MHAHDLYLKFPQSISGTVRDAETGEPIAGAEIDFSPIEGGPNRKAADAQGRYRLYVRSREVTLRCFGTPDRYNPDDVHRWRTVVAEPQRETTVDFCCQSAAPLTGRVTNPDGTPAKDACVRVSVGWPVRQTRVLRPGGPGGGGSRAGTLRAGRGGGAGLGLPGSSIFESTVEIVNVAFAFHAKTDDEGRFSGYLRQPNLRNGEDAVVDQATVSIMACARLPDRSLGGIGRVEAPSGEPLARPLAVTLEKTGAAVVRVLFQDGRPVADAGICACGFRPGSYPGPDAELGGKVEYLGDGRYRITGLTPGLDWRLVAFRQYLPTESPTRKIEIKPGQTTDAGEIRLESKEKAAAPAVPPGVGPMIEQITVDSNRAVIEGRASKNDKIVLFFGENTNYPFFPMTFPSSVHFKATLDKRVSGELAMQPLFWGVTDANGKELPGMASRSLSTQQMFVEFHSGAAHTPATPRPGGKVIVGDWDWSRSAPFRQPPGQVGVKLIPADPNSERDSAAAPPRAGRTVTGRVLTEPGGRGVAGATVGLRNFGWYWGDGIWRYAVTAFDGTYTFEDVSESAPSGTDALPGRSAPPGANVPRGTSALPGRSGPPPDSYVAWIETAPDRPAGVWSEHVLFAVAQQDVRAGDLYLKLPQSISGIVRDADTGEPIGGAWINVNEGNGDSAGVRTDAQGRYRLYVRPGAVGVHCAGTADHYLATDVTASPRTVVAEPQRETTVDFRCKSAPPLTGRVVNPDGTPARDARVRVSLSWPRRGAVAGASSARAGRGVGGGAGGRAGLGQRGDSGGLTVMTVYDSWAFDAKTDGEGRFTGYWMEPGPRVGQVTTSIVASAWLPDGSLGGVGRVEAPSGEPLAQPLVVTLEKTGVAVLRVLLAQDGQPVADADITTYGFWPGSDVWLGGQLGRPVEYLGDGRYRIAGLTAGLDYYVSTVKQDLSTTPLRCKVEIKPGQTTDAGEIWLELK